MWQGSCEDKQGTKTSDFKALVLINYPIKKPVCMIQAAVQ